MLEAIVLRAETRFEDGVYLSALIDLGLESQSESLIGSQEELVHVVRSWIESQDTAGTLEAVLFQLGFSDVGEETEIQLEFDEGIQAGLGQNGG
jgi:hypothetical protein|tara:strand:- start:419 stop:700 length:282 start_codon:yes stop_codon:yes gene_type:complete